MTTSQLVPVSPGTIGNVPCLIIDARSLHSALGVRSIFANWIARRITKYGFVEGQDFEVFSKNGKNSADGRPSQEYTLSIDMGKELCMVENNEAGRVARRYFIECERKLLASPPDVIPQLALPDCNEYYTRVRHDLMIIETRLGRLSIDANVYCRTGGTYYQLPIIREVSKLVDSAVDCLCDAKKHLSQANKLILGMHR